MPDGCLITNVPQNVPVSSGSELPLTVVYSIDPSATGVRGFYVQVESPLPGAAEVGEAVILPDELSAGDNQTFHLDLSLLTEDYYQVGVMADGDVRCVSLGTLEVTEQVLPEFTEPTSSLVVEAGDDVRVGLDIHDPAGNVHWRLFYIHAEACEDPPAVPEDELGTEIWTGQGNTAAIIWNTAQVMPGTYRLGLSTTDSGMTVEETFAASDEGTLDLDAIRSICHPFTITVEAPTLTTETSPLIDVTEPYSTVTVPLGEDTTVTIEFEGTIREPGAVNPSIKVFLDLDDQPGSGNEIALEANLPPDTTSLELNTAPLGVSTYYVGATIDDGVNPPVTDYARGRIEVALESDIVKLEVLEPDLNLPVKPGTAVEVQWTTSNVAADEATVDVFRLAWDASTNTPRTGDEITILAPTDAGVAEATFVANESGLFQINVRLVFTDTTKDPMIEQAPSLVQVTTLPKIFWVGDLATFDDTVASKPKGAIFEGHQFEDNAGALFAGGEDFNNDDVDDFLIVAQYGKPEFINPTGIGDGEAYLIRGNRERHRGSYNLNAVSSPKIPGTVLTGIPPVVSPTATPPLTTWGLTSAFIATDADDDGIGELMLGFPYVSEIRQRERALTLCRLCRRDMFENGGVVVVSSQNSAMRGNGNLDTRGSRLELEHVGMDFTEEVIAPEPGQDDGSPGSCTLGWSWMENFFSYFQGDCPVFEACPDSGDNARICPEGSVSIINGFDPTEGTSGCTEGNEFECLRVPARSYGGCLPNRDPRIGSPDSIADTLVQPKFGFAAYLAIDFINWYGCQ